MLFCHEFQVGAPAHGSVAQPGIPYGFKPFCVKRALDTGYNQVLWLDTSVRSIGPIWPVFDAISDDGYFLVYGGGNAGLWSSDACLASFGMSREESLAVKEIGGAVLGFDYHHPNGKLLFDEYLAHIQDFKGSWDNERGQVSVDPRVRGHRHDQTVLSMIAHKMGWDVTRHVPAFEKSLLWLDSHEKRMDPNL